MYKFVLAITVSRVHSLVQCAAVNTALGAINVPPQRAPGRYTATMDGKSPAAASYPTEILEPIVSASLSGHVYSVSKLKLGKCWTGVAAEIR